jgi:hypothetical protein
MYSRNHAAPSRAQRATWARLGAGARLAELADEKRRILAVFPELRGRRPIFTMHGHGTLPPRLAAIRETFATPAPEPAPEAAPKAELAVPLVAIPAGLAPYAEPTTWRRRKSRFLAVVRATAAAGQSTTAELEALNTALGGRRTGNAIGVASRKWKTIRRDRLGHWHLTKKGEQLLARHEAIGAGEA